MNNSSENRPLEECLEYFRRFPIYQKVFRAFCKKYERLGRFGGTVIFEGLSRVEKEQLQGFLPRVNPYDDGVVSIALADFARALEASRYAAVDMKDLLEAFLQKPLESNKQRQEVFEASWCALLEALHAKCFAEEFQEFREWMAYVTGSRKNAYSFLRQKFRESPEATQKLLTVAAKAIADLPVKRGRTVRLPVFATEITGDPHYFDEGTAGEKLLTYFIKYKTADLPTENVFLNEERWAELYSVGIMKDDLSNHVLAYGITGKNVDGSVHRGLEGFCCEKQPIHISLMTLSYMGSANIGIEAGSRQGVGDGGAMVGGVAAGKRVYVLENPAVFAALIEAYPERISAVCTNGQLRLASLVLLDLLVSEGVQMVYAGDFDPEGLQIADKLKKKYGAQLSFWLYDCEHYQKSLSDVQLPENRLAKLRNIDSPQLKEIACCIEERQLAGYQEKILAEYIAELL